MQNTELTQSQSTASLEAPRHPPRHSAVNDVGQICIHKVAQGSAFSVLSNIRAQRGYEVEPRSPARPVGAVLKEYRSFLTRAYPTMKKNNPHTPIMLREAMGTEPRVFARYGRLRVCENRVKGDLADAADRVWKGEAGVLLRLVRSV